MVCVIENIVIEYCLLEVKKPVKSLLIFDIKNY